MNHWLLALSHRIGLAKETQATAWTYQGYGLVIITFLSFFPPLFRPQEHLFFLLLAVAVVLCWIQGRTPFIRTPIDVPLLLFLAWVLFTIPFAIDPAYSFSEWRKLAAQVLVFYWAFLVLDRNVVSFSFSIPDGKAELAVLRERLARLVILAAAVGMIIVCLYALTGFALREDKGLRARAIGSDPNWLGTYAVIGVPLLGFVAMQVTHRWCRLACAILGVGLGLTAGFVSFMRAAWLGLMSQGAAFFILTRRVKSTKLYFAYVTVLILLVVATTAIHIPRAIVNPHTLEIRLSVWNLAIRETLGNPIVGIGYGTYTLNKKYDAATQRALHVRAVNDLAGQGYGPHSLFVMVAMGTGLIGLGLFIWIFVRILKECVKAVRSTEDAPWLSTALPVTLVVTGFLVRNVFDCMFAGSIGYLVWILIAVGLHPVKLSSNGCERVLPEELHSGRVV